MGGSTDVAVYCENVSKKRMQRCSKYIVLGKMGPIQPRIQPVFHEYYMNHIDLDISSINWKVELRKIYHPYRGITNNLGYQKV